MQLSDEESKAIEATIAGVESRTGVQVVVATINKADNYPELPWKAFAVGASLAAFGIVLADFWRPQWVTSDTAVVQAVTILSAASTSALLAIFVPPFARLFLRSARSHVEVRQYAQALFFRRELFRTAGRNAVLILFSAFERRIEILPDVGLHGRVSDADWCRVIERMAHHLRGARRFQALQDGLGVVEQVLVSKGFQGHAGAQDELPNRPIEERLQ